ncbi:DUF7504 family protein [Halorussus halobius]|uniref:DUF7504 family protein n=1 Tax=Halorussus halobius TaxID=1710537 RepID=UPI0010927D89|nr:hypothetical protein [Halorussus halobius]
MDEDRPRLGARDLRDRLQTLKQFGCTVLVTGNVSEEVSREMTRKLLGSPEESRTRILALTDQDRGDVPDLLPGDVTASDGDVYVADYGGTRAASPASVESSDADWRCDDLDVLRGRLCETIATAKMASSGFESGELRVSVFTLSSLLARHDSAAVEQFVSTVADHVRGVRGMGHFHLPVADDAEVVRRLAPLFDVRIELRETRGAPEQRWHFSDCDAPTEWVGL